MRRRKFSRTLALRVWWRSDGNSFRSRSSKSITSDHCSTESFGSSCMICLLFALSQVCVARAKREVGMKEAMSRAGVVAARAIFVPPPQESGDESSHSKKRTGVAVNTATPVCSALF